MILFRRTVLLLAAACMLSVPMGCGAASGSGVDSDLPYLQTESGLKYRVLRETNGRKPRATDTVTVHYRGWLDNMKEFDSSYKRRKPATFPLNRVVQGWTEGLQEVSVGGMIELEIPPELGYGARGAGDAVPPNATLHFVVELISIN